MTNFSDYITDGLAGLLSYLPITSEKEDRVFRSAFDPFYRYYNNISKEEQIECMKQWHRMTFEEVSVLNFDDINRQEISELLQKNRSFDVVELRGRMKDAIALIESEIESIGMTCRVYTYGRFVTVGACLAGGILGEMAKAAAVGMVLHNLATFDPDYEIAKNYLSNKLLVRFKR